MFRQVAIFNVATAAAPVAGRDQHAFESGLADTSTVTVRRSRQATPSGGYFIAD
jgi:hypothetical protein